MDSDLCNVIVVKCRSNKVYNDDYDDYDYYYENTKIHEEEKIWKLEKDDYDDYDYYYENTKIHEQKRSENG